MKSESLFKIKVMKFLSTLEHHWSFKSQEKGRRGIPDIIGCIHGKFFALELKKSIGAKPTPLQMYTLEKIAKTGAYTAFAYPENWDIIQKELQNLK